MIATAICQRLSSLAGGAACPGTVHSVFDHAVNLELEGREGLVGLIAEPKALAPYAVSVRMDRPFSEAGIRAGMAAAVEYGRIAIPRAGIELDCSKARAMDLSLDSIPFATAHAPRSRQLRDLIDVLRGAETGESLAPLATGIGGNVYTEFLAPRFRALDEAIRTKNAKAAGQAAERFAGCGPGLTPSSDDLLCGYLAMLRLRARERGDEEREDLLAFVATVAARKTNRISATFLLQCGEGLVNQRLHELFTLLLQNAPKAETHAVAEQVLDIGSTSGADMLAGVALALQELQ